MSAATDKIASELFLSREAQQRLLIKYTVHHKV